jgi:hypothetical protein
LVRFRRQSEQDPSDAESGGGWSSDTESEGDKRQEPSFVVAVRNDPLKWSSARDDGRHILRGSPKSARDTSSRGRGVGCSGRQGCQLVEPPSQCHRDPGGHIRLECRPCNKNAALGLSSRLSAEPGTLRAVARAPLDCPGSWLPVHHLQPGDLIACPLCGRKVGVTVPPPDDYQGDPRAGSRDPRVAVHWHVVRPRPQQPKNRAGGPVTRTARKDCHPRFEATQPIGRSEAGGTGGFRARCTSAIRA